MQKLRVLLKFLKKKLESEQKIISFGRFILYKQRN